MKNHFLHIKNLTTGFHIKRKRNIVLQSDISTELNSGEMICLLGSNGAGKSTLLRTLLGLQKKIKGIITYDDVPLYQISEKQLSTKVAIVLTNSINDVYLTVYEIVAMGRYPFAVFSGKLTNNDKNIIHNALKQVEMNGFSNKMFFTLSDGEKQKTLIARALVQETPFIFFDEPTAFIDAPGKIALMEMLSEIVKTQNKGILLTTHNINLALQYADKLWLLGKNLPFVQGIPEDLILQNVVQQYFKHNGIVFDLEQGKFVKHNKSKSHTVKVAGKSIEINWLTRALHRKGYSVVTVEKQHLTTGIYYENSVFVMMKNKSIIYKSSSISDLLTIDDKLF